MWASASSDAVAKLPPTVGRDWPSTARATTTTTRAAPSTTPGKPTTTAATASAAKTTGTTRAARTTPSTASRAPGPATATTWTCGTAKWVIAPGQAILAARTSKTAEPILAAGATEAPRPPGTKTHRPAHSHAIAGLCLYSLTQTAIYQQSLARASAHIRQIGDCCGIFHICRKGLTVLHQAQILEATVLRGSGGTTPSGSRSTPARPNRQGSPNNSAPSTKTTPASTC